MSPTRLSPPGSAIQDFRTPVPEAPSENLDAPAFSRGLTSFSEFKQHEAFEASQRVDAGNRSFNQQFFATMASEAGGSPNGLDLTRLAQWVSGLLGPKHPVAPPTPPRGRTQVVSRA